MTDLISRLSEKLDEVERVAVACLDVSQEARRMAGNSAGRWSLAESTSAVQDERGVVIVGRSWQEGPHIALWDPEAVLRLVAAHRKVIRRFQDLYERRNDGPQNEQLVRHAKAIATHATIEMLAVGWGLEVEA